MERSESEIMERRSQSREWESEIFGKVGYFNSDCENLILSAFLISRGAIFSRSGLHGRADCLAPMSARL